MKTRGELRRAIRKHEAAAHKHEAAAQRLREQLAASRPWKERLEENMRRVREEDARIAQWNQFAAIWAGDVEDTSDCA
jgi:hypothetical protein